MPHALANLTSLPTRTACTRSGHLPTPVQPPRHRDRPLPEAVRQQEAPWGPDGEARQGCRWVPMGWVVGMLACNTQARPPDAAALRACMHAHCVRAYMALLGRLGLEARPSALVGLRASAPACLTRLPWCTHSTLSRLGLEGRGCPLAAPGRAHAKLIRASTLCRDRKYGMVEQHPCKRRCLTAGAPLGCMQGTLCLLCA